MGDNAWWTTAESFHGSCRERFAKRSKVGTEHAQARFLKTTSPPEETAPEKRSPKGRRRLRKVVVGLLVLAVPAVFLLNGPGFRALVHWGISKGFAGQNLEASFDVEGTLLTGVAVRDLTTRRSEGSDSSPLQRLSIGSAEVRYDLRPLLRRELFQALKMVRLKEVDARVVLPADKPPDEEPTDSDPLEMVWKLLGTGYELEDINLTIVQDGVENVVLEGFFLQLPASGEGSLGFKRLRVGDIIDQGETRTTLRATDNSLTLGEFEPIEGIILTELHVAEGSANLLSATVALGGATLSAAYGRDGEITAQLIEGSMNLETLADRFGIEVLTSGNLEKLDVQFDGNPASPPDWNGIVSLEVENVVLSGERLDSATLNLTVVNGRINGTLDATRDSARVEAEVEADLREISTAAAMMEAPAQVSLTLEMPAIQDFLPENAPALTGKVTLTASLQVESGELRDGDARLTTADLGFEGVPIQAFAVDLTVPETNTISGTAGLVLDDSNILDGTGRFSLTELDRYDATLDAQIAATEPLIDLLRVIDVEKELEGSASISWKGQGTLDGSTAEGSASVTLANLRLDEGRVIEGARVRLAYQQDAIRVETLEVQSGGLSLSAEGGYENQIIALSTFSIVQGEQSLASGSMRFPYNPEVIAGRGVSGFFAQEGTVTVDLVSQQLPLEDIAALAGTQWPVQGMVSANIAIEGSLQQLNGGGRVSAESLKLADAPEVPPGDLTLAFEIQEERIIADGQFRHPQINALELDISVPFHPEAWAAGESDYASESIEAAITLPKSSLQFVKGYVSGIEAISGTAALDVAVAGTIGKPSISGVLDVSLEDLRFQDPSLPEVRSTKISLLADGESRTLEIGRFESMIAGGIISLSGSAVFPQGEAPGPIIDLRVQASEALLARSQDYNVRADADLALNGPWASARLTGGIGLTNSRFTKEIDILPIDVPGRQRSNLPEIEQRSGTSGISTGMDLGIDMAPFKDWTLDVTVVTKDPFMVRGNLARAEAISDLRLTGTGAKPVPNGRIYLSSGRLTLPFSKVNVDEAQIAFSPATGFNGELTVHATAQVRRYEIRIYLYGRLSNPQHVLTSDPPLPNEDIISLLATGATREELAGGGGGVAASKAAQLFLKKIRQETIDPDDEPSFLQELDERTTVDIGQTDARTGEQTVAGRIRLFKELYFVADVSQEGEYRGLLKYIFKFR